MQAAFPDVVDAALIRRRSDSLLSTVCRLSKPCRAMEFGRKGQLMMRQAVSVKLCLQILPGTRVAT